MAYSFFKKLENRILYLPLGSVITIADFTDIASAKTVSKMLTRLSKEGVVERVMRSVFWKPNGEEPEPDEVAKALARENGWSLAPSKETALHLFGMVDAKPKVWTYVTDGTYRSYRYGDQRISFTHTGKLFRGKWSAKTALFIQCLMAYGKEHITEEIISRFGLRIRGWDLKTLIEETKDTAVWIRKTTKLICRRQPAVDPRPNGN
ncbi:MAG: hypothetical protein ILO68_04055, partial [Clostridia bacterium]|nr:hypothetical protein [Clostridia bacterium]